MSSTNPTSIEKILNRSFDLAVEYQHEYVTLEHVLMSCLEQPQLASVLKGMGKNVNKITQDLHDFLQDTHKHALMGEIRYQPKYTGTVKTLVKQAKTQSMFMNKQELDEVDLVVAMFNTQNSWAVYVLNVHGINKANFMETITTNSQDQDQQITPDQAKIILAQFAINLNRRAQQNKIDPLIGRVQDVKQIVHTLARKNKNNVLLVGHPGTGKTQIVEGLAQLIEQKQVSPLLWHNEIWSLDVSSIVAGTKFRGDFEDRMKQLLVALRQLPNVILFIDEIHMIMGAGSGGSNNSMDVANILKPALGRGEICVIGSTTHEEYRKYFEKDRALARRFVKQDVQEPNPQDAQKILEALVPIYEKFHNVNYHPQCAQACVDLSVKYITNKYLPDKALDLLDAAGAAVKLSETACVTVENVQQQLSKITGINPETITQQKSSATENLLQNLQSRLFGQDKAVIQVVESVWMAQSGLRDSHKTMCSFLFSGPSGVGKTELARLLAENLDYAFVRFDMSEFQEKHSLSRLIGSPPGYVGYADGQTGSGALINALEQTPQCVLLIDEVEKAHPDVCNVFLQAMDHGVITSSNQQSVSVKNTILIFTSNLGADLMERNALGFGRSQPITDATQAVNRFFAPEFRNRLDGLITFGKLEPGTMQHILDKLILELNDLCKPKNIHVVVDHLAQEWLIKNGFDSALGARPLQRCLDQHIKKPMSKEILFGKLQEGGRVLASVCKDTNQIKLDFLSLAHAESHQQVLWDCLLDVETVS